MEFKVGQFVRFPVFTLHGAGTQAGTVKRIMPNGDIEIKAQQGGYYTLHPSTLSLVNG